MPYESLRLDGIGRAYIANGAARTIAGESDRRGMPCPRLLLPPHFTIASDEMKRASQKLPARPQERLCEWCAETRVQMGQSLIGVLARRRDRFQGDERVTRATELNAG